MTRPATRPVVWLVVLALLVAIPGSDPPRVTAAETSATFIAAATAMTPGADEMTLVAAGDIATCGQPGHAATAALLDTIPGVVATLGDMAYPDGTAAEFRDCYGPTWGRHLARTRPSPGNHEYQTAGASGYYGYFGAAAGDPTKGYYSYDVGAWHVVVLNSNCAVVSGCQAGCAQEQWLRAGPSCPSGQLHARLLAPPTVQHRVPRGPGIHGTDVGGPVRSRRRARPERPRAHLSAIRTADAGRGGRPVIWDPPIRRGHGRT